MDAKTVVPFGVTVAIAPNNITLVHGTPVGSKVFLLRKKFFRVLFPVGKVSATAGYNH